MRLCLFLFLTLCCVRSGAAEPAFQSELIFPLAAEHNHASAIVELPNGDLLVCWYRGSGERQADDVKVMGARKKKGAKQWTAPFVLADVPHFPDTNPMLFVDSKKRLWLFWQTIIANEWHTALTQYRVTTDWATDAAPKWQISEPLLVVPHNFEKKVREVLEPQRDAEGRTGKWVAENLKNAGDKYFSRMGWMTRAHATELPSGRILVPLYSDGYSFSLIAITDDGGKTWRTSEPLVGGGNIQPAIGRRKDGTLVAYMRDNGPPPKRLHTAESKDDGITWSPVRDTDIPNSGTGVDLTVLRDGTWALINNDTEQGRYSLSLWLSDDEGRTWKWKRHVEYDKRGPAKEAGSFHYPSIVQTKDGMIHLSYSIFHNDVPNGQPRKSIKHAWLHPDWVKQGN